MSLFSSAHCKTCFVFKTDETSLRGLAKNVLKNEFHNTLMPYVKEPYLAEPALF